MGWQAITKRTLVDFGRNSSIVGISHAARSKSYLRAVIWLTLFFVGVVFTVRGIWQTVQDYTSNPYLTTTEMTFETSVEFPAVTICNLNRYHLSEQKSF